MKNVTERGGINLWWGESTGGGSGRGRVMSGVFMVNFELVKCLVVCIQQKLTLDKGLE